MDDRHSERTRPGDQVLWIHLFVSVVAAVLVYMRVFEVAGCSNSCNYSVIGTSTRAFWWTDLAIFVVVFGSYIYFRARVRRAWIIPTSGIAVTLMALAIANIALSDALG